MQIPGEQRCDNGSPLGRHSPSIDGGFSTAFNAIQIFSFIMARLTATVYAETAAAQVTIHLQYSSTNSIMQIWHA